jgi:hypothetical protein
MHADLLLGDRSCSSASPSMYHFFVSCSSLDGYEPSTLLARALAWRSAKGGELSDVRENVEMCEIGQSGRSLSSVN